MNKIKYYYFFRGDLSFGVHFFQAWVNAVRERGFNMKLITFLSLGQYFRQFKYVKEYSSKSFCIYPSILGKNTPYIYFFISGLLNRKIIIHLKKRSSLVFNKMKIFYPNKLKYIVEGEGDPFTEREYLLEHFYKRDFYKSVLEDLKKASLLQKEILQKADLLTVGTKYFKKTLIKRYPDLDLSEKISVCQMSFTKDSFFFQRKLGIDAGLN